MRVRLGILILLFSIVLFPVSVLAATWAKSHGGSGGDQAASIQQTSDGGFIFAGTTSSYGAGNSDILLRKDEASGNLAWQKTYGGSSGDVARSIQQTSDGGYIVAGYTSSYGAGNSDIWVLKLNSTGNVTWQRTYGGSGTEEAESIQQTSDGGYIVAGRTYSYGAGNSDIWVLKLNSTGSVTWHRTYGGSIYDYAESIQQTSDGGYIVAGYTSSYGAGSGDMWVLKLNSTGSVTWQKTYGGSGTEEAESIQQTSDGGYIVAGHTSSYGAGTWDYWVLKLNSTGSVTWQKTYGGSDEENAESIQQTSDGGYIVAGYTYSYGAGSEDIWVLKLNSTGSVTWQKTYGGSSTDIAYSIQQTSDGGYIVAGYTESYGAGGSDIWLLKLDSTGDIPGCGLIGDTSMFPASSYVTPGTTSVTTMTAGNTIYDSSVTPATVVPYIQLQCYDAGQGSAPPTPASISYPSSDNDGNFTVSWSSSSGATGYTLQRATNASFTGAVTEYSGPSTSYNQTGLGDGTYYYRVSASNVYGSSGWRNGGPIVVSSSSSLFIDVPPDHWAYDAIYKIYNAGITNGCSVNPLMYCPDKTVSKAAMAVFLLRSLHGGNYTPPPATGIFTDVNVNEWYAPWVEQLYKEGITKGCSASPLMYCPDRDVSKASMALFLLRAKYGSNYIPPVASGIFTDVPLSHWGADWIEKLYNDGITQGCSADPLMYCPDRAVSKAAMALFIIRTFGF